MDLTSPSSDQDYERMLLSQERKKRRLKLSRTRCGDLVLLGFITIASLFSVISLITQSISFGLTGLYTGHNLTCTLFVDYSQRITSPSPSYCYSTIGITALILLGLLIHSLFIGLKCCFNREWKCLESLHPLLGLLLLVSSISTSALLSIGFQHTCSSLQANNMTCDVVGGVAYKDLMRQAPTSLWLTAILLLFIETIFVVRTAVYYFRCIQTGRLDKEGKGCVDCSSAGKKLRRLFSR